jgi:hypothetical protein
LREANEDEIVYRNGAKQTDLLVCTDTQERETSFQVNPHNLI